MEVTWVVFYYEDKELEAYPLPGIFPGEEIETTLDSISYDCATCSATSQK